MKQLLTTLIGTLLGVGLALWVYDRFVVQPREHAAAGQLAASAEQARNIAESVDASVARSVQGAQQAFDAQAADQERRRVAVEALSQLQLYKVALAESYLANGRWPAKAADAGLPERRTGSGAIREIVVGTGGTVTVTFDATFAEGARVRLVPKADPDSYQVAWTCTTTGDADLKRYLPSCARG